MDSTVIAVYENGILRPLTPLALPEHARVQIRVQEVLAPSDVAEHRRQVHEVLVRAGLSVPVPPSPPTSSPMSSERREELVRLFGAGRPLSELIIEERGDR
jgi:predicted DNA-binding antitoxin AbrB/MazE fold protein